MLSSSNLSLSVAILRFLQHPYGWSIICAAGLRHSATNVYKSVMPLAYVDDVDIIGRSIREVEAAFSKLAEEARSIGLAVNE